MDEQPVFDLRRQQCLQQVAQISDTGVSGQWSSGGPRPASVCIRLRVAVGLLPLVVVLLAKRRYWEWSAGNSE